MKLVLQVKLTPSKKQRTALRVTMERFNQACNFISKVAFQHQCFRKFELQKQLYHDVKKRFGLSAQVVIRAIGKVVDSYKVNRETEHQFQSTGAMVYDQRIMSFKDINTVSLWTLDGRIRVPIAYGAYQKKQWHQRKGQANLVFRNKVLYLLISVEVDTPPPTTSPKDYIGIDFGVVNIATDSTGEAFSGEQIEAKRIKYSNFRVALQRCGSKSAKRHLKKISNKESRFRRDVNHCIAKKLVSKAKRSQSGIVVEDLTGIRDRMKARKKDRAKMHGWAFYQLRMFVEYKAKLAGIPVVAISPQYTSQRCSNCGYISSKNRKTQSRFKCCECGFEDNADYNAALNIRYLADVSQRIVGPRWSHAAFEVLTSPKTLVLGS